MCWTSDSYDLDEIRRIFQKYEQTGKIAVLPPEATSEFRHAYVQFNTLNAAVRYDDNTTLSHIHDHISHHISQLCAGLTSPMAYRESAKFEV